MKFTTTAAAAIAALMMAGGASAATYTSVFSCDEIIDIDPNADACFGTTADNDNAQQVNVNTDTFVEDNTSVTGLFGYTDWTIFDSEPDFQGGETGSFSVPENSYGMASILLKSGNTFAAYLFEDGIEGEIEFTTANERGLSNYVVAGRDPAIPIPLPAAGWLMLAGLGGLAVMRRRKKAA